MARPKLSLVSKDSATISLMPASYGAIDYQLAEIDAIIFDCFGVLYPSYVDVFYNRHRKLFGENEETLDELCTQIDLGQITQAEFNKSLSALIGMPVNRIEAEFAAELVADSQLLTLIASLKKKYKIGLLSNAGKEEIAILQKDGVASLFDVICISYELGIMKPSAEMYATCLDKLQVAPARSVFVDDNVSNLKGAGLLGIQTIHYPTFGSIPKQLLDLSANS